MKSLEKLRQACPSAAAVCRITSLYPTGFGAQGHKHQLPHLRDASGWHLLPACTIPAGGCPHATQTFSDFDFETESCYVAELPRVAPQSPPASASRHAGIVGVARMWAGGMRAGVDGPQGEDGG